MQDLTAAWESFLRTLKRFSQARSTLNPPCPAETLHAVERGLGFELPGPLAELLRRNNGQTPESTGIFKSVSGWDVYTRHRFLDAESMAVAYKTFLDSKDLVAELGSQEIPFAIMGTPDDYREAFSIHRTTHAVSLLWTEVTDPCTPAEWQLTRYPRGENLAEFFRRQIDLF